jgi:hypothetical protein
MRPVQGALSIICQPPQELPLQAAPVHFHNVPNATRERCRASLPFGARNRMCVSPIKGRAFAFPGSGGDAV